MKHIKVIQNIFPFGKQEHLQFTFLILLRIFINARFLRYSFFRIWYVFTTVEFCRLELVSLLSTTHAKHLCWCNECLIFGV